ncbi:ATP-binding protein [Streptomyces sp. NRRL S-1824]|uniref:ATP-binding protein n=1 Tax=Streptomyces sp. NRRL S-1824 TaxID=1463889 RepID=UPI0004C62592|nr:ATP-binding protein [Streptomyces sp. NRRL S-1824]
MSSGDVLMRIDDGGRVIDWSPSAGEVFGWSAEEAVGRSVSVLMHENAAAARRQLEAWKVDEDSTFTTELIVSELVGNAVRYGAPPLRLRLILDGMLTCEVSDAVSSAPHLKHARTIDETGRGLFIVATVADNWGTHYEAQGKTVWAQQLTGAA